MDLQGQEKVFQRRENTYGHEKYGYVFNLISNRQMQISYC